MINGEATANPHAIPGNPHAGEWTHQGWTVLTDWLRAQRGWVSRTEACEMLTRTTDLATRSGINIIRGAVRAGALEVTYRDPNHAAWIRLARQDRP